MTVREMIRMLSEIPQDAEILAYSGDEEAMIPVTGIVYNEKRAEICTDDNS